MKGIILAKSMGKKGTICGPNTYDIKNDTLGHGKFKSLWHSPFIFQHCLTKGSYILASPEGYLLLDKLVGANTY
jgi:hypothetical protein